MPLVNPLRYDRPEDVRSRLNGTVAFYKQRPVYLMADRDRGLEIAAQDILEAKPLQRIHSSDEELDVQAKPLGYVNVEDNRVLYVMRTPTRRTNQCIHPHNLYWFDVEGKQTIDIRGDEYRMPSFGKMLVNEYPSFDEAISSLDLGYTQSIAFGRKLAMRQSGRLIRLFYFTRCLGVFNRNRRAFAIPERLAHYVPLLHQQKVDCFQGG